MCLIKSLAHLQQDKLLSLSFPFAAPVLSSFSSPIGMAQGILSEYAINTLVYSAWEKGLLSRKFSQREVNVYKILHFIRIVLN